jgi:hypothetical protein
VYVGKSFFLIVIALATLSSATQIELTLVPIFYACHISVTHPSAPKRCSPFKTEENICIHYNPQTFLS